MARHEFDVLGYGTVKGDITTGREKVNPSPRPGLLGVHKVLGGGKGYSVTHLPTGRHVLWARLQGEAKAVQRELEGLNWDDPELVEVGAAVAKFRAENLP